MTMASPSRYEGKPLLRLLELYVLRAIGELSVSEQKTLLGMTPKLQEIYGKSGDWHEVIASAVQLPPEMPEAIREMWQRNVEIAQANNVTLSPQDFAQMFVDENLTNRIMSLVFLPKAR